MLCFCKSTVRYWMVYCHIYIGASIYFLELQGREKLCKDIGHALVASLYSLAPCLDVARLCFIGFSLNLGLC